LRISNDNDSSNNLPCYPPDWRTVINLIMLSIGGQGVIFDSQPFLFLYEKLQNTYTSKSYISPIIKSDVTSF